MNLLLHLFGGREKFKMEERMVLDQFRLDRQVAVVTGGSRGIGRAIAAALAGAGADIVIVSRTPNVEMERTIGSLGRRYFHLAADLTEREQTKKVIPRVLEEMGDLHILVNNSGIVRQTAPEDFPEKDWDATLEINLHAPFILSQAAGRIMLKKGKGKIINIVSVMAFQGGANVAYTSSKHGLAGMTKNLANAWAGRGINVNAIAPGWIATEFTLPVQNDPERSKFIIPRTPSARWGQPEDLAGAALFLASPASDWVHGVILPVDGGWLVR
jgi:2-deoxy-D-gluconate 3-dehydrogenase